MESICRWCGDIIHRDPAHYPSWVDESDGDCCSGDDDLRNENGVHEPVDS